ncbi:MAG TPA: hypothetical protein VHZ02_18935 [Acidimicrobiales bacterium]|nr:hypothetical protein [Acidimicrobiales bacterium]
MRDGRRKRLRDDPQPTPPRGSLPAARRPSRPGPPGDDPPFDDLERGRYSDWGDEPGGDDLFEAAGDLEASAGFDRGSAQGPSSLPAGARLDPDPGDFPPPVDRGQRSRADRRDAPRSESRASARRNAKNGTARDLVRAISPRDRVAVDGGSSLTLLVLACDEEDTAGIDLASGALVRARVPWPSDHRPDLAPFDVVETVLADRPERDDLAQPEAVSAEGLPRRLGTLHGRRVRQLLHPLAAPMEEHVLGFPGLSAPYWEFRGFRPSLALLVPTKGPVLFRRDGDRSVWIRFGWGRSDNWLPMEDLGAIRALNAARRDRLQGKDLAAALGFKPHYLVASVSRPRDGHCYKAIRALVPRG